MGIIIARTVSDSTGRGCFAYTVTKSGASASVNPLPSVPKPDCVSSALVAEILGAAGTLGFVYCHPRAAVLIEPVSADSLPKTGIFADKAGDF